MAYTIPQMSGTTRTTVTVVRSGPAYGAYQILHVAFTIAPIVAGIDKFFHYLTNWDKYLSATYESVSPLTVHSTMMGVGAVEIVAGLIVAFWPRVGAYLVAIWLLAIVVNLILIPGYFDIALRDLGLCLAAIAFGRLADQFHRPAYR